MLRCRSNLHRGGNLKSHINLEEITRCLGLASLFKFLKKKNRKFWGADLFLFLGEGYGGWGIYLGLVGLGSKSYRSVTY